MDRTAWIAIVLCSLGLVGWYVYVAKQTQSQQQQFRAAAHATVAPIPEASLAPSASATPAPSASPTSSVAPSFAETTETLRNSDVEL